MYRVKVSSPPAPSSLEQSSASRQPRAPVLPAVTVPNLLCKIASPRPFPSTSLPSPSSGPFFLVVRVSAARAHYGRLLLSKAPLQ